EAAAAKGLGVGRGFLAVGGAGENRLEFPSRQFANSQEMPPRPGCGALGISRHWGPSESGEYSGRNAPRPEGTVSPRREVPGPRSQARRTVPGPQSETKD